MSDRVVSGDLQSVDGYMNIALERCKEWTDGKVIRSWGDAFVRGNNGMSMRLRKLPAALANSSDSDLYLRR